jgi:hypothetical protein
MKRSCVTQLVFLSVITLVLLSLCLPLNVSGASNETVYKVVWPLGKWSGKVIPLAPPVNTLKAKTICNLVDREPASYLNDLLKEKSGDLKIISRDEFAAGFTGRSGESVVQIDTLAKLIKEKGCDAVITGVGI